MITTQRLIVAGVLAIGALPAVVRAQSVLDHPPNVSGDWVTRFGTIQFNFQHRFEVSPPPVRKVTNYPTFLLGVGLPAHTMVGFNYSTNSVLAPGYPNEWEFFGRWLPLAEERGAPLDIGGEIAYNLASEGLDGEVSIARRFGPVRVLGVARALSDPYSNSGDVQFALGGGATLRLLRWLGVEGDYVSLTKIPPNQQAAWSAGLAIEIPGTPHSLSLYASNAVTATLQGASRGMDQRLYGFEFTIPFTLSRYFGRRPKPAAPAVPQAPAAPVTGPVVTTGIDQLAFLQSRIEIAAGTTITWKNQDQLQHTVTADDNSFDSGLLDPGAVWSHTFDQPGTFTFHCTPHPFMTGTVVVR